MDNRFDIFVERIFKVEGGKSNVAGDSGGKTNYGITQGAYNAYRKKYGLASADVFNITRQEAAKIYYENYYVASGADRIADDGLAYIHFDTAVNFGVGRAKQFLAKARDVSEYNQLRLDYRKVIIKSNPAKQKFAKGWSNRDTYVYALANLDSLRYRAIAGQRIFHYEWA